MLNESQIHYVNFKQNDITVSKNHVIMWLKKLQ